MDIASSYIASAYPNSDLSAPVLLVIALVMAASLAAWLGLVFLADRQQHGRRTAEMKHRQAEERLPAKRGGTAQHSDIAA
jgi:hypothetical protein